MMLRRAMPAAVLLAAVGGWLSVPVRWRVEGLSMAPGLMPGDIVASGWFPWADRCRAPRRFERWTLVEPGGAMAVKRIWGLPGEEIDIIEGDVAFDGAVVVKPPAVLAEVALPVPHSVNQCTAASVGVTIDCPVFDDVPFAPDERRLLAPVRDVGIAVVLRASASPERNIPPVEVRMDHRMARVHLPQAGRFAVAAGRLDGCFVAGGWPLDDGRDVSAAVIPRGAPAEWSVRSPWNASEAVATCAVAVIGGSGGWGMCIESVTVWRDIHALPPPSNAAPCRLGPSECFVLGDFPAGSRDSRHWGAIDVARLRHRLAMPRSR